MRSAFSLGASGGPVGRTPCPHFRGSGFDPWWGTTQAPASQRSKQRKREERQRSGFRPSHTCRGSSVAQRGGPSPSASSPDFRRPHTCQPPCCTLGVNFAWVPREDLDSVSAWPQRRKWGRAGRRKTSSGTRFSLAKGGSQVSYSVGLRCTFPVPADSPSCDSKAIPEGTTHKGWEGRASG